VHVKESMPSNDTATASHRLRLTNSPISPQIGSAFTNNNSAHPIGEDQKTLGGDNVRPAAPVKVASAEVLALVGACGWPSEIWLIALTTEVHSCGWPSEIWLTAQVTEADPEGGVDVMGSVGDTDTEIDLLVDASAVLEVLAEDDGVSGVDDFGGGVGEDDDVGGVVEATVEIGGAVFDVTTELQ
jgi:hypothetical protein